MKKTRAEKGITLVALIITIIVLLILAVVAIKAVQGDGIIAKAKSAQSKYTKAQVEEEIKLALSEWKMLNNTQGKELGEFLKEKFDNVKGPDGEGSYIVTLGEYEAIIDKDGNLIEIEKAGPRPVVSDVKVVANSDGTGESLAEKSITDETQKLYITFTHTMSDGSGETTVSPSIPFEVTENGTYEFTITGTNGVTKIQKVTVNQYKVGVKIGSFVNYDVSYTDIYVPTITYDNSEKGKYGWRLLAYKDNEDGTLSNVELISTGIPMILNYNSDRSGESSKWWASGSFKNQRAVNGLLSNMENIPYSKVEKGIISPSYSNAMIGLFEGAGIVGNYFRSSTYSVKKVTTLTLSELNTATNKANASSSSNLGFKDLMGTAKGLFDMRKLDNYGESTNYYYWLATYYDDFSSNGNMKNIYYVAYGSDQVRYSSSSSYGIRPVVYLNNTIKLEDKDENGVFEITEVQ